jgi:hypothetical protein
MGGSMAIRREIIYELAKKIPVNKLADVIDACWEKNLPYMNEKRRRRTWLRKNQKEKK